jgi:hypothetical protein
MKTTLTCCTLSFLLLSGCGRSPPEGTATESGSSSATESTSPSGDVTESTSPSGNSDSDSPTSDSGGVSDSQTDTGDTTAPTSAPTTVTDSDPMTATDTLTTDTTSPIDPSDSDSTSTSDSQGSDTDTSIGDTSSTGDTGTTVADDTTTSDDTTTTSDDTTGEPIDCGLTLKATIRDFQLSHPDMEDYCCGQINGLVQNDLGGNDKPVFANIGNPQMLTDAPTFNQWYTDVNGVNQKITINIDLTEIMPGVYSFSSNNFFPVDNMLWGNEGQGHNFHFTTVPDTS